MSKILSTKTLEETDLKKLFHNEIIAIHVQNYAAKDISTKLSRYFLNHPKLENHPHDLKKNGEIIHSDYGVDRVGVSYNTTFGKAKNSQEYKHYFTQALSAIRDVRKTCFPYLMPFDQLRLELDENWSSGASIANFEGKKMHVGIARVMKRPEKSIAVEVQPHFDALAQNEVPILAQFSANIYISVPNEGGELELWDVPPIPVDQIIGDDGQIDWRSILPESIVIKPQQGDLILFNTRRPHAIKSFKEGVRITLQSFIGLKPDNHLMLWN